MLGEMVITPDRKKKKKEEMVIFYNTENQQKDLWPVCIKRDKKD